MANVINWFEIPTKNFDKACEFYGKVLGAQIHKMDMPGGGKMGLIHSGDPGNVGGALVQSEGYEPSQKGSLVYLNGGEDLSAPLDRVEKSGGRVLLPKTSIGQNGFMAHFTDPDGNRVALHSMT